MMRSKQVVQVQAELDKELERTIQALKHAEKTQLAGIMTQKVMFLKKVSVRERNRKHLVNVNAILPRADSNVEKSRQRQLDVGQRVDQESVVPELIHSYKAVDIEQSRRLLESLDARRKEDDMIGELKADLRETSKSMMSSVNKEWMEKIKEIPRAKWPETTNKIDKDQDGVDVLYLSRDHTAERVRIFNHPHSKTNVSSHHPVKSFVATKPSTANKTNLREETDCHHDLPPDLHHTGAYPSTVSVFLNELERTHSPQQRIGNNDESSRRTKESKYQPHITGELMGGVVSPILPLTPIKQAPSVLNVPPALCEKETNYSQNPTHITSSKRHTGNKDEQGSDHPDQYTPIAHNLNSSCLASPKTEKVRFSNTPYLSRVGETQQVRRRSRSRKRKGRKSAGLAMSSPAGIGEREGTITMVFVEDTGSEGDPPIISHFDLDALLSRCRRRRGYTKILETRTFITDNANDENIDLKITDTNKTKPKCPRDKKNDNHYNRPKTFREKSNEWYISFLRTRALKGLSKKRTEHTIGKVRMNTFPLLPKIGLQENLLQCEHLADQHEIANAQNVAVSTEVKLQRLKEHSKGLQQRVDNFKLF